MKVSFYLTDAKNPHDGITVMMRNVLSRCTKFDMIGGLFLGVRDRKSQQYKNYFPMIKLNLKRTFFPTIFLQKIHNYKLPYSYTRLLGKADAYIFFYNFIPHCKIEGKKIVVLSDLTPIKKEGISKKEYNHIYSRYKYTVSQADLVLTLTEYSKKDIIENFPEAEGKVKIVGCGADTSKFIERQTEEKKKEVREKYKLPEKYVLFVGQARDNKNLARLLKAYAGLSNEIREKYGLVYANTTPELNSLAEELNIQNNVRLLNGIDSEDLVAVYQGATTFTLVSLNEGFGIPLIEAMAAEVPVLCSNISCLPEVVGDAAVTVDPYSEEDITRGLTEILSSEELRKKLIELGKDRAKIFTWEKVAEKFEQYVEEFIKS